MKQDELINLWNNLPAQEKIAYGDHWIVNESHLSAWNKPFAELSKLKQERVLQNIESFSQIKDHSIRGSSLG